ncbi:hypothetical protein VTL71DRAFT_5457 [Oculimacula yallundae]|uniref:Uncharacterized protein n=1 Tax=Oculimacula yallundae TaxID=86028 RepID=A0ABR4C172_9HELO
MQLRQIVVLATWLAFASAVPIAAPEPEPLPYCITIGARKRGNCRRDDGSVEARSPIAAPEPEPLPYCITIGARKRGNCRRNDGPIEKRSSIAESEVDQVIG